MKKYKIPVIWEYWGILEIEADNLEKAKKEALESQRLPRGGEYIEDSNRVDDEGCEIHNNLEN
jgi:hypothetical protein